MSKPLLALVAVAMLFAALLLSVPAFATGLVITQGDTPTFTFYAETGEGERIDLTGATFSTDIKGALGALVTVPNSQHTADPDQEENPGKFTMTMTAVQTAACSASDKKDIITKITQGTNVIYVHGTSILTVKANVPLR